MTSDLKSTRSEASEPKKASRQILEHETVEGVDALERPLGGLFMSGLSAGLPIGFSLFLMAVVRTCFKDWDHSTVDPLVVNTYAIGFLFLVLGRSELHIEQTTCFRFLLWTTLGNALGGSIFVALIQYSSAIQGKPSA
ncbi:MAG TPA: hypothetical protein VH592_14890 [Gemmataceae bacterium]|jgi:formate/nitrite transporter FocA (FNT family)